VIRRHQRHVCPLCGRTIADTGTVYWTVPHQPEGWERADPTRTAYVYLRRHNRPDGVPCPSATTRVLAPRRRPEGD
jgi:hypothetical protein